MSIKDRSTYAKRLPTGRYEVGFVEYNLAMRRVAEVSSFEASERWQRRYSQPEPGPTCFRCEIEQGIGYCRCEIAANH